MLFVTIILFLNCMCTGVRGTESNTPTKLVVAGLAIFVGLLFYFLSSQLQKKQMRGGIIWFIAIIIANSLTIGGIVAIVSPLIATIAFLFKHVHGFWTCLFAWFCLSILIGVCTGIFIGMLKSAFVSLLSLDFSSVILCLMLALAGLYGVIPCIQVAMGINGLVGFGCFLSLLGGGALGYSSPAVKDESVIYDANGNPHYVVGRMGPGRVSCTDGQSWRQEEDGHFSQIND